MSELDPLEFYAFLSPKVEELKMDMRYLTRNVNEGFSGGEKKRNEILQLAVLEAEMSILDEIDSGLDIDALRDVSHAVNSLRRSDRSLLMITHYQRLLDYIAPDFVHVMIEGKNVQSGGKVSLHLQFCALCILLTHATSHTEQELAKQLEQSGYAGVAQ